MDDKNIFSERLKELLHSNDMTQTELSDSLGISSSMLSYYIRGIKQPSVNIIKLIAKKFNVSIDWLLGLEEPKDTELKTYADMIKLLIPLLNCSNIWDIELNKLDGPFNYTPFEGLVTADRELLQFLDDYEKMKDLVNKNSVPKDLFNTWINNRLEIYSYMNLPHENED